MINRGPGFLAVVKVCLREARPAMQRRTEKERQLSDGMEGGRARSQIIRSQESLVLYKSFNALWIRGRTDGRSVTASNS